MLPYPTLIGSECIVYDALKQLASRHERISQYVLSDCTGYHPDTVRRAVRALESRGLVEVQDMGNGRCHHYVINEIDP